MTGVIYARYSSDNQQRNLLRGSCVNVKHLQKRTIFRSSVNILTALYLSKRTTALIFKG